MTHQGRPYPPDFGADQGGNSRLFRALWRGKWWLLILPVLGGVLGEAYLKGWGPFPGVTPILRATAKVIVGYKEVSLTGGAGDGGPSTKPKNQLNQQRVLIKSDPILRAIADRPEIRELRHFKDIGDKPIVQEVNTRLGASVIPSQDILQIHFDSPYRKSAERMADIAVEEFLAYTKARKVEQMREQTELLLAERQARFDELAEKNRKILDLKTENVALITGNAGSTLAAERLADLYNQLSEAKQRQGETRASYDRLLAAKEDPDLFYLEGSKHRSDGQIPGKEDQIAAAKARRIEVEGELQRIRETRNPDFPAVQAEIQDKQSLIDSLKKTESDIILDYAEVKLNEAKITWEEARQRVLYYEQELDDVTKEALGVEESAQKLAALQREQEVINSEIDRFLQRINELNLDAEAGALNLHRMEPARIQREPVKPDKNQVRGSAAAAGLGLALAFVLLRGMRDKRIQTVEEVPELLGASVLAVFPRLSGRKSRSEVGRVVERDQGSLAAEAVRSVRTATTFGLPDNGNGVALVTSSVAGEGKSVTASNLAIALAQAGRRTILVDADLRSPGQNEIYGVSGKIGMGDVLNGVAPLQKAIARGVVPGLDLLPAGDAAGRAAELIEGKSCAMLIRKLKEHYDCVVIDSSPVLETSEARVLASLGDLTIFVLRLDVSSGPDAVRSRDILQGVNARILGVVLNGSKPKRGAKAYAEGIAYGSYSSQAARGSAAGSTSRVASSDKGMEAWS